MGSCTIDPVLEKIIFYDIMKSIRVQKIGFIEKNHQRVIVKDLQTLINCFNEARKSNLVIYDIESTSLEVDKAIPLCISFTYDYEHTFVVPIYGHMVRDIWGVDLATVKGMICDFLTSNTPKGGHNVIAYDNLVLKHYFNIDVNNVVIDTMFMHHVIDEEQKHNLEFVASLFHGGTRYKAELKTHLPKKSKKIPDPNYSYIPEEILWDYCADDTERNYFSARSLRRFAMRDETEQVHDNI